MLNLQQIENIIKPNKKHYEMRKHDMRDGFIFFFDGKVSDNYVELLNNEPDKLRLHLSDYYKLNRRLLEIVINNNAIELKHYLNIKITKQDIIDWLETFTTKYNGRYLIPARECWTFYVYTSLTDIDGKKSKCFGLMATQYTEDIIILQAKKSQEYWRLYNIIKNLKE